MSSLLKLITFPILFPLANSYNERYGEDRSTLNSIFRELADRVNTETLRKELIDLIVLYSIDETEDALNATAEMNLLWLATYSDDIQEFLDDFFRTGAASASSTISCFIILFGLALNWIMQN